MSSYKIYNLDVFWDDEYRGLDYQPKICGDMADMRGRQPAWNHRFIEHFESKGWQDIGTSYYRMTSGTVMPVHQDRYVKYIDLFDLQGQEHTMRRALVLLEDWQSGHYFEVQGEPLVKWCAGTVIEWKYDTPHMAANLGLEPRYTLQITGHV